VVITDELRAACAWVADHSKSVRVFDAEIDAYAHSLAPLIASGEPAATRTPSTADERETQAAFWLTLDAINFGSGWFPTLRKRQWPTGYRTIEGGLRARFDAAGPWTAAELRELREDELARWLDQDPDHELIGQFVRSLNDLGDHMARSGSFSAVVDAAGDSAVSLVATLARWDCFRDVSLYADRTLPFLKRAQIAAADLDRAGVAGFSDLGRLTMFADNLVPHVLRLDGVLWFEPELVSRIERGELIEHGSPAEVEIRACAVHAVELIVAASTRTQIETTAARVDELLWSRGQAERYKAVPRHRSRGTAY
jgi:Potential Queuosine, Q, salvage protein family